ncbi:MAG: tyrosine-protein phosphatase [Verrucomicrobia bacterium]|nr:tyrosine-protein phosphatase [Verrucomicrobiota bacterium]
MNPVKLLLLLATVASANFATAAEAEPPRVRPRPADWAAPLIQSSLENGFRVSDELYRCEQPGVGDAADLRALGIRSFLNLRHHHTDSPDFAQAGFTLLAVPMSAGSVTVDQLVAALRQFRDAPKPVVVHCLHGSDRTGVFVATYRMVVQGWSRSAAIDEFRHGGFGFHEKTFPNLLTLLESVDLEAIRRRVRE